MRVRVDSRRPAVGALLDGHADRLEHLPRGKRDLADRLLERLGVLRGRFAIATELADELAGGGFDLPGRRGRLDVPPRWRFCSWTDRQL